MFIAQLFTAVGRLKQPNYLSVDRGEQCGSTFQGVLLRLKTMETLTGAMVELSSLCQVKLATERLILPHLVGVSRVGTSRNRSSWGSWREGHLGLDVEKSGSRLFNCECGQHN